MKFTFGIITSPQTCHYLQKVVDSIVAQGWDEDSYEIIIVGGKESVENGPLRIVPFDESVKPKWITKKKNLITKLARYDVIAYMHDYVALEPDWCLNFEEIMGGYFHVCMSPIINADGTRFRDWMLEHTTVEPILGAEGIRGYPFLLPYDVEHLSKFMYFSGSYWVAKKWIMEKYPLNEDLAWGEGEDVEWSKRVRANSEFKINIHSPVKLLKYKPREFSEATPQIIEKLSTSLTECGYTI